MSEVGWPSWGLKRPWRAVIPVFPAVAAEARGGTVHPRTFSGRHDLAFRIAGATAWTCGLIPAGRLSGNSRHGGVGRWSCTVELTG